MKYNYPKLGERIGKLVAEKQLAYGDSYGKSGELLKVLFPNGIPVDMYKEALAIVRVIDKLFRLCTDPNYNGESPWADIVGYGLLRLAEWENKKVVDSVNDQTEILPPQEYQTEIQPPEYTEADLTYYDYESIGIPCAEHNEILEELDKEIEESLPINNKGQEFYR